MSVISFSWPYAVSAGSVASFSFSGGGLSLRPAPVRFHEVLWKMSRWFDGIALHTLAIPAFDVACF